MSEEIPVKVLCEILNINRSGYYKWKARQGTLNRYEQNREDLTKLLLDAHGRHKTYGYHRLADLIRRETGWVFSDNLAHQCCKYANIKAKGRRTYKYHKGEEHVKFPNMVAGQWTATRPMEIVASDMTVLKTKNGTKYEWTYILDTFNNEIIASSLSKKPGDVKPYFDCLKELVQKAKEQTALVVLHTDQGSVYSSRAFEQAHADCTNLKRSMSRVGTTQLLSLLMVGSKKNCILTLDYTDAKTFQNSLMNTCNISTMIAIQQSAKEKPQFSIGLNWGTRTFLVSTFC